MPTAHLVRHDQSQTVHRPKALTLPGREVDVRRVGDAVHLVPTADPWAGFTAALEQFTDDLMEKRSQPLIVSREPDAAADSPQSSTSARTATQRPRPR